MVSKMQFIGNFLVSWGIAKLNWSTANPFNFAENAFRKSLSVECLCIFPKVIFSPAEINSQCGPKDVDVISAFLFI